MENYKYYIVPELMTWARPMSGLKQTPIEYYETIDAAAARFKELRAQPYNDEATLNENNGEPYTRLCLGIERTDAPSAIDILHVRNGVHYLVDDYRRVASMKDDTAVLNCLQDVSGSIGFDRVRPYVDSFDYKEVPQFLEQLQQQQEKTPNKSLEQIITEARSAAGRANDAGQTKAPHQHAAGEVHGKFDT